RWKSYELGNAHTVSRSWKGSGDFGNDFSVEDALKETSSVKQRWDRVTTTTKRPATTKAPAKPAGADLDLADALDDRNDPNDGRRKPSAGGGGFSDKDLEDIAWGGGYKPDKGKGDDPYGSNDDPASGMSAETGTIAGVASALAMALIGAVSSYISYQQKKPCPARDPAPAFIWTHSCCAAASTSLASRSVFRMSSGRV
uniref:CD99 antigen-like protein 2 n=1 Tax=Equus caballus TaxID=9796 RepID=A0A9L0RWS4_HORSE